MGNEPRAFPTTAWTGEHRQRRPRSPKAKAAATKATAPSSNGDGLAGINQFVAACCGYKAAKKAWESIASIADR